MADEAPRNSSRTSAKKELRLGTPDVTRAAKITAAVVGVLALAIGLWYARTAILLAFAGILLAIVLYGASRALAELTALPRLVMLAAVVIALALFFGVVIATAGPTLAVQIAQLARGIAAGAETLGQTIADADLHVRMDVHQGLAVGVDRDQLDAGDLLRGHAVDGVAAAASDAEYLDWRQSIEVALTHLVGPPGFLGLGLDG